VKIKIFAALLLFSAVSVYAEGPSASLLYKIQLEETAAPADTVLENNAAAGVYDAFNGSYTVYRGGQKVSTVQKDFLKGGNCLVKNGNYFLYCNSVKGTLDMLSENMEEFASFSLPADMKGKYDPTDAIVSGGYVFSTDNDNHRIIKTDLATGSVELSAGGYGQERLAFWYPYGLAIDSKGVLYVSEVLNTRIQKITTDLKFYEFIGRWGINPGEFYRPTGITLFKGNRLIVADGYTGVIQCFDNEGRFAGILKDPSGAKLKFGSVTHIRLNGNVLAVVDAFSKAVYVYELKEQN
jgi:sugar lactone lactonase YvrE